MFFKILIITILIIGFGALSIGFFIFLFGGFYDIPFIIIDNRETAMKLGRVTIIFGVFVSASGVLLAELR